MFNWTNFTIFLTQILLFVLIFFFSWSNTSANCSCHSFSCVCEKIKFIPLLPPNTTSVTLKSFRCFLQKKFLVNLSSLPLEELHFDKMNIIYPESDIFKNFPYLKKLTFKLPYIHTEHLNKAFQSLHFTKIFNLKIESLNINSSLTKLLLTLKNTNITELSLIRCKITTFEVSQYFSSLRHLQYLNLSENFITKASWSTAKSLQVLSLKHSKIKIPTFLSPNRTSFFPNLIHLEISVNEIQEVNSNTFEGLDNLEYLYICIFDKSITIFSGFLNSIPKLKSLYIMASNYILVPLTIEYGAFKSKQLQHLTLEYFRIKINQKGSLFYHTPNLLSLKLKLTRLFLFDKELNKELMPLTKLQTFVMTLSALKNVPNALCNKTNLTWIDLGQNDITFWNITNCPVMSSIRFFSLSNNKLNIIEKNTFSSDLIENNQLVWDLSLNPFLCNCHLFWFINWCHQKQDRLKFYPKYYICETPPELKGQFLNPSLLSDEQCATENSSHIIMPVSLAGCLILVGIGVAIFLYYKRWSIRYFIYLMQSRRKQQKELESAHNYLFDAFVCYHNSNIRWLLEELCPKLEVENNFSLCIHDRDFVAGWDIVENIVESIEKSRKVLFLLSNKFALSHWCQFEMTMAYQRVIERKENLLIVILLENIDISNQSRKLTLLLKQKTYLEWTDNREGQDLFWNRLIYCLKAPNAEEN